MRETLTRPFELRCHRGEHDRRGQPGAWHARVCVLAALLAVLLGSALANVPAGLRLVDEGRFVEAMETFETVIERSPADVRAYYLLARAAVYAADALPEGEDDAKEALFDRAAQYAEAAVERAPDDPHAHFEVARALGRLAQYRGVLASLNLAGRVSDALDRTLALDPEHAGAWHARALFHVEVPWIAGGRSGQVVPSFERAVAIEPDVLTHRVEFARVLIDRGEPEAAAEHLEVALTLTPRTYFDRQDLAAAEALREQLR